MSLLMRCAIIVFLGTATATAAGPEKTFVCEAASSHAGVERVESSEKTGITFNLKPAYWREQIARALDFEHNSATSKKLLTDLDPYLGEQSPFIAGQAELKQLYIAALNLASVSWESLVQELSEILHSSAETHLTTTILRLKYAETRVRLFSSAAKSRLDPQRAERFLALSQALSGSVKTIATLLNENKSAAELPISYYQALRAALNLLFAELQRTDWVKMGDLEVPRSPGVPPVWWYRGTENRDEPSLVKAPDGVIMAGYAPHATPAGFGKWRTEITIRSQAEARNLSRFWLDGRGPFRMAFSSNSTRLAIASKTKLQDRWRIQVFNILEKKLEALDVQLQYTPNAKLRDLWIGDQQIHLAWSDGSVLVLSSSGEHSHFPFDSEGYSAHLARFSSDGLHVVFAINKHAVVRSLRNPFFAESINTGLGIQDVGVSDDGKYVSAYSADAGVLFGRVSTKPHPDSP